MTECGPLEKGMANHFSILALRNVSNFRYAESEEELMTLLMKVKEESENWLKTQHSKSNSKNWT